MCIRDREWRIREKQGESGRKEWRITDKRVENQDSGLRTQDRKLAILQKETDHLAHFWLKVGPRASNPRFSSPRTPAENWRFQVRKSPFGTLLAQSRSQGLHKVQGLLGNAYIWPPRELRGHSRKAADAGRAYGHSHNAFLFGNAYIWATQRAPGALQERS